MQTICGQWRFLNGSVWSFYFKYDYFNSNISHLATLAWRDALVCCPPGPRQKLKLAPPVRQTCGSVSQSMVRLELLTMQRASECLTCFSEWTQVRQEIITQLFAALQNWKTAVGVLLEKNKLVLKETETVLRLNKYS